MRRKTDKAQEINFKPYIGLFFSFSTEKPTVCRKIYGNAVKQKVDFNPDLIPATILVVDEKRNFVKFFGRDGSPYWTRKTHIKPIPLPDYSGSPMPLYEEIRNFLIYCTDTKISDFSIETMAKKAIDILPALDTLIEKNKLKIIK